jgi:hypothetical protein
MEASQRAALDALADLVDDEEIEDEICEVAQALRQLNAEKALGAAPPLPPLRALRILQVPPPAHAGVLPPDPQALTPCFVRRGRRATRCAACGRRRCASRRATS